MLFAECNTETASMGVEIDQRNFLVPEELSALT